MNNLNFLSILVAGAIATKVVHIVPDLGFYYFVILFVPFAIVLLRSRRYRFNISMLVLYFMCSISIIFNDIPELFSPWTRFTAFLLVSSVVSPFVFNEELGNFRLRLFFYIQKLFLAVAVLSFIGLLAGFSWNYGGFGGITGHAMLLSPVSAISFLYLFYLLFDNQLMLSKWKRWGIIAFMPISALMTVMSASRSSFIGLVFSVAFFLVLMWKKTYSKVVKFLLVSTLLLMATSNFWLPVAYDGMIKKNRGSITTFDLSTRTASWEQRISEFVSSPLIGIGFGSVDITADEGSLFSDDGKVETGSSWLMAISMTGLLGAVPLVWIFLKAGFSLWQIRFDRYVLSSFLMAQLVFWAVHMCGEGYIYAAGSFLFFNCWLLLGVIQYVRASHSRVIKTSLKKQVNPG